MKTAARARSLPTRHPLAQAITLALALGAGATQADVFNVTTNADSGTGSLREAVLDANANPDADQITFDDGLGTIFLTSGQIDITETLTITGPGAGQTIDAGGNSRILAVTETDQSLTLENLTITGGSGSRGGGFYVRSGDVTLTNSTVSGNSAPRGGGLVVYGNVTLTNSTVTANQSGTGAGGIDASDLDLTSTVLAGNSGPEGNFNDGGTLNASNSLFGDDPSEINGANIDNVFTDMPSLFPLADNGCAVPAGAPGNTACVQTHALLPDSPALDAGSNPLNLATDERGAGFPRVLGPSTDIGAFESRGTDAIPTNTPIPSLAPWGLALLSGLLGLIGWRFAGRLGRRRE